MADAKFVIDGKEHEIPSIDTFDIDEALVLYEYTGFGLEELIYDEDADDAEEQKAEVAAKCRHPGLIKALLHVAYQRSNPQLNKKRVAGLIGTANYTDALVQLASGIARDGDDEDPPSEDTTRKPPESSPASSSSKPDSTVSEPSSSGNGSPTSSETGTGTSGPGDAPPISSTPASVTPFPDIRERMPAA